MHPDSPDLPRLRRRTLTTLLGGQILGGVGVASGIAVTALVAQRITGDERLAGLGTTAQVLGGALLAVPLAGLTDRRGRRTGLTAGYVIASVGAVLIVLAAVTSSFPLLLLGTGLFGGATASNSQTRFAAADLAEPAHVGRDISLVVWATTIGSVVGPNLAEPAGPLADALGLPPLTGSYVFSLTGFVLAVLLLQVRLRPDPLLAARRLRASDQGTAGGDADGGGSGEAAPASPAAPATRQRRGSGDGLRTVLGHRDALLGLIVVALGHAVMVGVMVMTPLHMDHGGAALRLIGMVISIHILGMYALSPLTGVAVDRLGPRVVAVGGGLVLLASCLLAATAHAGMSTRLTVALFGLGVGWSGTLMSGSTLLTRSVEPDRRPAAQGVSDLAMGLAGAGAGAGAGVVLGLGGYPALALVGATVAVLVLAAVAVVRPERPTPHS